MNTKDIAMRVYQLRVQKGISARKMSIALGQNEGYINNIETGKSKPSLDGIYSICKYLNISLSEFFDSGSQNPMLLNDIIEDLKQLNTSDLQSISSLIKRLLNR